MSIEGLEMALASAAAEIERLTRENREIRDHLEGPSSTLRENFELRAKVAELEKCLFQAQNAAIDLTKQLEERKSTNAGWRAYENEKELYDKLYADFKELEAERNTFKQAVEHVTENGKTKRSFTASEGWTMIHNERYLDLLCIEEAKHGRGEMKTRYCDECKWMADNLIDHICKKQHFPLFYKPKSPIDQDWGWKRKCEDFEEKPCKN